MKHRISRRDFLEASKAVAAGASMCSAARSRMSGEPSLLSHGRQDAGTAPSREPLPIRKGVLLDMLPRNLGYRERFKLARDAGFEVLQVPATGDHREAEAMAKAAQLARIDIDSVMNRAHWEYPLSSSDPAVVKRGLESIETSLRNAKFWGAQAVLLVPAVVNPETSYREAWVRSQKHIRSMIPLATELKVVIAIEEVWNKFLLSPLEMAAYVDQFGSPWVQAWFDVGNVVLYGYPQDWIHTLGSRINRLHLKDFKMEKSSFSWENLGDGDIDWASVRRALGETGFHGSAICELEGGDASYLRDLSKRVDRLVLGINGTGEATRIFGAEIRA